MGKMGDVASQGRTVLFVSHNMAAVKSLCTQGLVMKSGAVVCRGGIDEVIAAYLATKPSETDGDLNGAVERDGEGPIRFTSLKVFDQFGRSTDLVQCGQEISIELGYASANGVKPPSGVVFHIYFTTIMEERLFICSTQFAGDTPHQFPGAGTLRCSIPCLSLLPGQYRLDLACHVTGQRITMDRIRQAKILTVVESDFFGSGKLPPASVGPFLVSHSWQLVDDQLAAMNAE
jgi:lipopolysaccharide transport system ATP-binding protein